MKTGIVLEMSNGRATVLQSGGAAVTVRAQAGWQVGDVVRLAPQKKRLRIASALAACLALVAALGGGGYAYFAQAALVSLDVNPSLEMGLNRFGRVLDASAKNEEGEAVLAQTALRGKSYEEALAAVLAAEDAGGYLASGADVVVTVFAPDAARQDALRSTTEAALAQHGGRGAEYYAVGADTVRGAHACGVTAGKYLYLTQLQAVSPDIDLAACANHSIAELRGQIRACQNEHGAQTGHGGGNGHGHGRGRGGHHAE